MDRHFCGAHRRGLVLLPEIQAAAQKSPYCVHLNYRLWDTNYFAYDYLNGSSRFAIKYEDMSTKSFVKHYKHLKPEIRDFVFKSYANPVYSMLRETGQSEV